LLDNKGQMRTIEAFLAILLMFSAFALTTLVTPAATSTNNNDLATVGTQALISMDNNGELGKLIDERNWAAIADVLNVLLPVGMSYNLTVYDENLQPLNNVTISNGIISDQNMVSVQYPCVSQSPQGNLYLLRLQLATAR
jgi:hypothetical protein